MLTTTITTETTLGSLITQHPSLARKLEKLGLDYCCGGQRTIADATAALGLDAEAVVAALSADAVEETVPWSVMGMGQLVDHIEHSHHRFLWDEMPRLSALLDKIVSVHGDRHPELTEIRATYTKLREELEPHLRKEEAVLFPAIRQLSASSTPPGFPFGSVQNPISMLMSEHDGAGELLERLRELTHDYEPPADGCATYQATFAGLAELEADTHLHVHKENNLLFPGVVRLEERLADASATATA